MSNSGLGYNVNTIIIHKSRVFKSLSRVPSNSEIAVRKFHTSNCLEDKLTVVLCLVGVGVPVHENLIFAISTGTHKHGRIDPSSQGQTSSLPLAMTNCIHHGCSKTVLVTTATLLRVKGDICYRKEKYIQ